MPEPTSMKYYYGQDVPTMSKYFDAVVPMIYKGNYYAGTKWIKKTTKQFVKQSNGAKIWSGLQTYDSDWNIEKLPYKELMKDVPDGEERIKFRFSKDENGKEYISYINKMSIKRFKNIIKNMDIHPIYIKYTPLRSIVAPLAKIPVLNEVFYKMVTCVIEK
jgi:spore germination protein YaaH